MPACFQHVLCRGATATSSSLLSNNRDFVRENFSENSGLKGIFTLGKQDVDVQNQIAQAKSESDGFLAQIGQLAIQTMKTSPPTPISDADREQALQFVSHKIDAPFDRLPQEIQKLQLWAQMLPPKAAQSENDDYTPEEWQFLYEIQQFGHMGLFVSQGREHEPISP